MKRYLALGAVAAMVACGGGSSGDETDVITGTDTTVQADTAVESDTNVPADAIVTPDVATETSQVPSDHQDDQDGTLHASGKNDPLANCTACHGAALSGGTGGSCYACHNADDHTRSYHGIAHMTGTESSCEACHGPDNQGGLGPACNDCH